MLAPRQQQRVDQAIAWNLRTRGTLQFGIDEGNVERGVVDDEGQITDEAQKVIGNIGKERLVGEKLRREAMHGKRLLRHIALRIDVAMKRLAGGNAVEQLNATDFNEAIPAIGIKARRLGIENDFRALIARLVCRLGLARNAPRVTRCGAAL